MEIIRRETIKPSSPTPEHLRIVKLSMIDQVSPDIYVPLILFYPYITTSIRYHITQKSPIQIASERVHNLRETLSEVLALYYPFAGRFINNNIIECNDEGAEFIEAKSTGPMSMVLKIPDEMACKRFLGAQPESRRDSHGGTLLSVQATIFICGGISLGLSVSHKLADACTISEFVRSWANTSRKNSEILVKKPEFGHAANIFPPIPDSLFPPDSSTEVHQGMYASRRFVFTAEKIAAMKRIVKNNPTRFEAVSSLLLKCTMKATSKKVLLLFLAMNIRKRMVPPVDDNIAGNLVCGAILKPDYSDQGVCLHILVETFRKRIDETAKTCTDPKHFLRAVQESSSEIQHALINDGLHTYTSWCRFGLYEVDFGWEKPIWVSTVSMGFKNSVVLMDTKDGYGIEVYLILKEEDMALMEADPEFLAYASLNPSVV